MSAGSSAPGRARNRFSAPMTCSRSRIGKACTAANPAAPAARSGSSPGRVPGRSAAGTASRVTFFLRAGVRLEPQPAGKDVAGNVGQPQIIDVSVGAQADECLSDADAELLGEHPGGLVDLGPVQGQVRVLAARAGPRASLA